MYTRSIGKYSFKVFMLALLMSANAEFLFAQSQKESVIFTTTPRSMEGTGLAGEYKQNRKCNFMLSKMRKLQKQAQDIYYTTRYKRLCREENAKAITNGFESLKVRLRNDLRENGISASIVDYKEADQIQYYDRDYALHIADIDKALYEVLRNVKNMEAVAKKEKAKNQAGLEADIDANADMSADADMNVDADMDDDGGEGFRIIQNMQLVTQARLRNNFKVLHQSITDQAYKEKGKHVPGRLITFTAGEQRTSNPGPKISNIFTHFFQIDPPIPGASKPTIFFRLFMYDLEQKTQGNIHPLYFKKTGYKSWNVSAASYIDVMHKEFQYIVKQFTVE